MSEIAWYFDFVSPYSYFAWPAINRWSQSMNMALEPILFAGLLNHWGQKGPAEIAPKRTWTYRACVWWAEQHNVPFRMPAAHPFNSLPYLRLVIAARRGQALAAGRHRAGSGSGRIRSAYHPRGQGAVLGQRCD